MADFIIQIHSQRLITPRNKILVLCFSATYDSNVKILHVSPNVTTIPQWCYCLGDTQWCQNDQLTQMVIFIRTEQMVR